MCVCVRVFRVSCQYFLLRIKAHAYKLNSVSQYSTSKERICDEYDIVAMYNRTTERNVESVRSIHSIFTPTQRGIGIGSMTDENMKELDLNFKR